MAIFLKKNTRHLWIRRYIIGSTIFSCLTLAVVGSLKLLSHPAQAITATFTVTTTADAGPGSLRDAITLSNATQSTPTSQNLIQFSIPGTGVQTIALQSALPQITQPTIIDGSTQPGSSCGNLVPSTPGQSNTPHVLNVEVISPLAYSSSVSGTDTVSFSSTSSGSVIRGIVINGLVKPTVGMSDVADVRIFTSDISIECAYLGVKPDGITPSGDGWGVGVAGWWGTGTLDNIAIKSSLIATHANFVSLLGGASNTVDNFSLTDSLLGVTVGLSGSVSASTQTNSALAIDYGKNSSIGGGANDANIIGGVAGSGIYLQYADTVAILGNHIGESPSGQPLKILQSGIDISYSTNTRIGSAVSGEANSIANANVGIRLAGTNDDLQVYGNIIGLKHDSTTPAPNFTGISGLFATSSNPTSRIDIGGPVVGQGNVIGGNQDNGIVAYGVSGSGSVYIKGNWIGVNKNGSATGNGSRGIAIGGGSGGLPKIHIGGVLPGEGNTIANNTNGGVQVFGATTTGVSIRGNKMYSNSHYYGQAEGIILSADWWSAASLNDSQDGDNGPNHLQNYPILGYSMTTCDGATDTRDAPPFNSTPSTTFTIDYYANPSWNPNSSFTPQGEQWVSSETVTTDANGNATLTIPNIAYPSATATGPDGSTSELGSINAIRFTQCQDMTQRSTATTVTDFNLSGNWMGMSVPTTYYRNQPRYPDDYNSTTGQFNDRLEKVGLTVQLTVGGHPFIFSPDPPEQTTTVYAVDNNGWHAQGHIVTALPEGAYDVVITLTDPTTGMSMTKTYVNALRVALPKITYSTTITNNQTPTLTGTAVDIGDMYKAYIVPAGTTIDPSNPPKERVLRWQPNLADPSGFSGSWIIITNKDAYISAMTSTITTQKNQSIQYHTGGQWARDRAGWFTGLPGVDTSIVTDLLGLQNLCVSSDVQQRIQSWFTATITDEQDCRNWLQQEYTTSYDSSVQFYDDWLQDIIANANSSDPTYDFTPFSQGKYDIYITGSDLGWGEFTTSFPNGLIIDLSKPTASISTDQGAKSPALEGTVSDPAAKVEVTINGRTYTAINRGDGTWVITAGTIAPMTTGTYTVTVTVTNLAGTSTTTTHVLSITAGDSGELVKTGQSVHAQVILACVLVATGAISALYLLSRKKTIVRG